MNVGLMERIDTTFDFQTDTPTGKDPDAYSPTLRRYHKLLWSKPLPDGTLFELSDNKPGIYLSHCSPKGNFKLSSDSIIASYSRVKDKRALTIIEQVTEPVAESFRNAGYTIGGMLIFPSNRINNKPTINAARGLNVYIKDRFDLTLECIRRYYRGESSPLEETIFRYTDFFKLFKNFQGYVEFFLLQGLVESDFSRIKFFLPFDGFKKLPIPSDIKAYLTYRERNINFIETRNRQIQAYCSIRNDLRFKT